MRVFASTVCGLFLLAALTVNVVAAAEPRVMTWTVDGAKREALVFAPNVGATQEKLPLIFAFHGQGGNMRMFAKLAALETHWPGAIVVYPQGLPTASSLDQRGLQPGWQHLANEDRDRDLKFVDAMLATLRSQYHIDENRTYATGFSNGAIFSLLLWAQRSSAFNGFAVIAGALDPTQHLTVPKPVLHITGSEDPFITRPNAEKTIAEERRADGAGGNGQNCGAGCTLYRGRQATVEVIEHAGGHIYPPQAAEQTVEFFRLNGMARPTANTAAQQPDAVAMPKAEIVQYKSHDSELIGFVYKPPGNGPFPVYMWNHGNERDPAPAAIFAKYWLPHGFVLFVPLRSGHGPNPGKWIIDAQKEVRDQGSPAGFQKLMALYERANDDVVAAYNWIARQPFVDPKRIVVAGASFGAVQSLLVAERDRTDVLGVKCVIAMAPASESWANPNWAKRLGSTIDNTRVPIFLFQASNDVSLGPSETLGPRIDAKGFPNRHKVFPPHGDPSDHSQGRGAFFGDTSAWGDDVLAFLHDCRAM